MWSSDTEARPRSVLRFLNEVSPLKGLVGVADFVFAKLRLQPFDSLKGLRFRVVAFRSAYEVNCRKQFELGSVKFSKSFDCAINYSQ